jgi:hypothetical protein
MASLPEATQEKCKIEEADATDQLTEAGRSRLPTASDAPPKRQRVEVRSPRCSPRPADRAHPAPPAAQSGDGEDEPDADADVASAGAAAVATAAYAEVSAADSGGAYGMEAAEEAAGLLAEAAAGAVLGGEGAAGSQLRSDEPVARLRGLPWSFTAAEVGSFLATAANVVVRPEMVTMMHNASGEAFVVCESAEELEEVVARANRQQVGSTKRYVEVFASTLSEMNAARLIGPLSSHGHGVLLSTALV